MLGFKWDHKLQKWVVFDKASDKILSKHDSEKDAKRAVSNYRSEGIEEAYKGRRIH